MAADCLRNDQMDHHKLNKTTFQILSFHASLGGVNLQNRGHSHLPAVLLVIMLTHDTTIFTNHVIWSNVFQLLMI